MELLLPFAAAVLVGAGVFLVLARALIRVILGLSLIAYGVNLSILLSGGMAEGAPPLLDISGPYVDPLPQALILTAIVIGFGTTALLLVLSIRAYQATGTDEVQELTEKPDPPVSVEPYADPERPSISPERGPDEDAPNNDKPDAKDSPKTSVSKDKTDEGAKPKKRRAKKSVSKTPEAKKTTAKKTTARKTTAKKTTAKKSKVRKTEARKIEAEESSTKKTEAKKRTAKQTKTKNKASRTSSAKSKTASVETKNESANSLKKAAKPRSSKKISEPSKKDPEGSS